MKLISYCNKVIEYSFYTLFFLVPLVFAGDTSELFELNKMWLAFGITVIIGTAWATKMLAERRIAVQRTPIDILLLLFLASQIISSIFSLDSHVSWWGYYSRFNGGLLSTICYIILYYAFVTNMHVKQVWRTMLISLFSGLAVSLWGFPSHFGADPTCLIFRGNFDTSCWTDAFKPTVRTFSTLGQPEWLAAYMAFLLPVSMSYMLKNKARRNLSISFLALTILFYLLEIYSSTRAGFIAFWLANILFWAAVYFKKLYPKQYFLKILLITNILFLLCTFLFDSPLGSVSKYTLPEIMQHSAPAPTQAITTPQTPTTSPSTVDITDSGTIRLLVWKGAIKAWQNNPLFGTGVETFAFAYYKYKSPAHNLTSEWDYLYNKAHNEYLNYLATTGIIGLGTYLAFIALFLFLAGKWYFSKSTRKDHEAYSESAYSPTTALLVIGIMAGYVSILITNFFGFSVVIMNLYLFIAPALIFIVLGMLREDKIFVFPTTKTNASQPIAPLNSSQWIVMIVFIGIACWMIIGLIWYRQADIAYALGNNLDQVGQFQQAYPQLAQAVQMEPNEPVYEDELAINLAALAAGFYSEKQTDQGALLAKNAIALSTTVTTNHPNNVVYWKDRVRLFYTLSASDTKDEQFYLQNAINAINTAKSLAPNDAKIAYNQGVLYGQAGDLTNAISMLNNTIKLRPNYADAYIALGLFYHEAAIDKNGKVIHADLQQKAISTYTYVLAHLNPGNTTVKKSLEEWRSQ